MGMTFTFRSGFILKVLSTEQYSFVHDGKTYSTKRGAQDTYLCPCPSHQGVDQEYSFNALDNHLKSWKAVYDADFGPHQETLERIAADLYDTATLRSLGLCINTRFSLLICISCAIALVPSQGASHLAQKHLVRCTDLSRIIGTFTLGSSMPVPLSGPIPPVAGLPILNAFKCLDCGYILGSEKNLKQHISEQHPRSTLLERYTAVAAQHLNNFSSKTYFEVIVPVNRTEPLLIDDYIAKVTAEIALSQSRFRAEPDPRNVPSWLQRTGWHVHVSGYCPKTIRRLVMFPSTSEFPTLKKYVSQLLHECCALIKVTPVLVLQKLNSPYIAIEGINNKPFSLHQEYETTMASYASPVIVLVAMLLRRTDEYEIALPSDVESKVTRVRDALDEDESTAKDAIFDLLLALWTMEWPALLSNSVTDPTVHYLVLYCLQDDGTFLEPVLFTNVIARLEYGMRSVFLRAMHDDGHISVASKRLERWYQEKVESPFNTLRTLQHDLSAVAYSTFSLPRVVWTDDQTHQHLRYCGAAIALSSITTMFTEMEKNAVKLWEDRVLLGLDLHVEIDHVYDDMTNTTSGYSFLTDHRNTVFQNKHMLLKAIYENETLRTEFILSENEHTMCWNIPRMRVWLADYARLQRLELILAHCTAGSPSRGTEITAMLYSNTTSSLGRNVAFVADTLTLLCTYQKTSSMRGQSKLIPHALSGFSSDLLVQDLAIARPFAEFVAHIVFSNSPRVVSLYRRHIFVNNGVLFTTPDMTAALEEYTLTWLGEKLGVNGLRHIFTAFRRKLCNRMEELFAEDNMDSIGALQMGHSRGTENRVYGLEANGLGGAPEDLLRLFLEASSDWQIVVRLVPGGLKLRYRDAMAIHFQSLMDAQRIRTRRVVQPEVFTAIETMFDKMWAKLSQKLDAALPVSSSLSSQTLSLPDDAVITEPSHAPKAVDEFTLEKDALQTLRLLLQDPEARWSSYEQRTAVLTMLRRKQDLVALLPTGSGKSMVALIPAMMETNSITVLVCPLRSLMMDYERRFRELGVRYEVYDGGPIQSLASLVLVSADAIKLHDWRHHLCNLHDIKPIARFVFDEAHIPIMDASYRPTLLHMYEMRSFLPVQVGLLSGSVPLHAEALMKDTFGIGKDCVFLRASCNRPELQYIWKPVRTYNDYISSVVNAAQSYPFAHPDDRGLIYVTSTDVGGIIASQLSTAFYNSHESITPHEKSDMYNNWRAGKFKFMVCTTAFGAGNDYPRVRVVLHAGTPFEIVPYLQETGRAGRDGKPAVCIMFPGALRHAQVDNKLDISGSQAMFNAMRASSCIRSLLTAFIDGTPTHCNDDEANQRCSFCDPPPSSKRALHDFERECDESKRRKTTRLLTENDYGTTLKDALVFWSEHCIFCQVVGNIACSAHSIIYCPTLCSSSETDNVRRYRDFKGLIRYMRTNPTSIITMCFKCAVPRGMPVDVHPQRFIQSGATCTYPDIIIPLAWAVFTRDDLRLQASRDFGVKLSNQELFTTWLSQTSGPHPSNAIALFLWYHERYGRPSL